MENVGTTKKSCGRGHWKSWEDAKLRELVAMYGPRNWNLIAQSGFHGRSGKSCRLRWYNQLDPKVKRMGFSEEEEERLMEAHRVYGNKWAFISRFIFPGRTDNAVKNHWHVMMARKHRDMMRSKSYYVQQNPHVSNYDHNYFVRAGCSKNRSSRNMRHMMMMMSEVAVVEEHKYSRNYHFGHNYISNNYSSSSTMPRGSTSQISFASPSSPAADHREWILVVDLATAPPRPPAAFIDFLGVGGS